ncbi:hypothetical protein CXF81_18070 [Glaciecola sp. 33A]|nr:hypothetical protein CXF81_18070 [Glaciecola sp. 33A]
MRRRLEASWHKTTKQCDLTATVNDAAVQGKFTSLSGKSRHRLLVLEHFRILMERTNKSDGLRKEA